MVHSLSPEQEHRLWNSRRVIIHAVNYLKNLRMMSLEAFEIKELQVQQLSDGHRVKAKEFVESYQPNWNESSPVEMKLNKQDFFISDCSVIWLYL